MKILSAFLGAAVILPSAALSAALQSAEVTKVVNDVRIYRPASSAKKAKLGDSISGKTSLQTGRRSKSELRFQDETITRLGSNSIFSFEEGTRDLRLEQGTVLLTVPKNAGGARIRTATVTAAVTGTTIMMEYFRDRGDFVKIIVLEGSLTTWVEKNGKQSRQKKIKAGQMVVLKPNDSRMQPPVDIDLARLVQTSGLVDQETFGPLPGIAQNRISSAIGQQSALLKEGSLIPTNSGSDGPSGVPAGGGGLPGEQVTTTRDVVNNSVEAPIPPREGDDPGGPPPGGDPPGEGDDP